MALRDCQLYWHAEGTLIALSYVSQNGSIQHFGEKF